MAGVESMIVPLSLLASDTTYIGCRQRTPYQTTEVSQYDEFPECSHLSPTKPWHTMLWAGAEKLASETVMVPEKGMKKQTGCLI